MKNLFSLLALCCMISLPTWATRTVTFQSEPGAYAAVIPLVFHEDGVTLSVYGTASPPGYKFYSSEYSFLSTSSGRIIDIVFHDPSPSFVFALGTYQQEGNSIGHWTGHAITVNFKPSTTVGFAGPITVTIDDNDTTQTDSISCLDDIELLPDNAPFVFASEVQVIYQYNQYLYIQGECGRGLVFGNIQQTYDQGDIIPPGWGGIKRTYNGTPEATQPSGFKPACRNEFLEPTLVKIPWINASMWAMYVELRNVRIDPDRRVVIDGNGNEIPYYPELNHEPPIGYTTIHAIVILYGSSQQSCALFIIDDGTVAPPPSDVCSLEDLYNNVNKGQVASFDCPLTAIYQNGFYLYVKDSCDQYGLMYGKMDSTFSNGDLIKGNASWTTYQENYQLAPSGDWAKVGETTPVEPFEIPIEELSGDMVHRYVRLVDVKIINDGISPMIEDETGTIDLFDRFRPGIIDDPAVPLYPGDVNMDNEVNIADANMLIDLLTSATSMAQQRFGLDAEDIDPEATYDIDGFISIYHGALEIIPVRIVRHHPGMPHVNRFDVNDDGEVNIADVNAVISLILSH